MITNLCVIEVSCHSVLRYEHWNSHQITDRRIRCFDNPTRHWFAKIILLWWCDFKVMFSSQYLCVAYTQIRVQLRSFRACVYSKYMRFRSKVYNSVQMSVQLREICLELCIRWVEQVLLLEIWYKAAEINVLIKEKQFYANCRVLLRFASLRERQIFYFCYPHTIKQVPP